MKKRLFTVFIVVLSTTTSLTAQHVLKGKVRDANNTLPLVGATVWANGVTQRSVTTNESGAFSLNYDGSFPVVLFVSYQKYETKEVALNDSTESDVFLLPSNESLSEITVKSRRRNEVIQDIPIPISFIGDKNIENSVSFNVNRVKELVPSVQLYSSNPRNTTLNIRGLGSTLGLTNDGVDPGVGFYVDGVYYARAAATTLDFMDVQQIEVLRGPQGTLFGKNTTAGAFNVISKKPTFFNTGTFEQTFGNFGFIQTKGSISGPLIRNKLAVRLSLSGTYRDGNIYNVRTEKYTNTLNNQGIKAQFLYHLSPITTITLSMDYTSQRPDGYAQVFAGAVPTKLATFKQFDNVIADLGYTLPSRNPFDRLIDHNTPWRSNQDMGGASLNVDFKVGNGVLTATSAWRTWKWDPSNDRDFTGLQALSISKAPSIHHQFSQELRYAGSFSEKLSGVVGVFAFYQKLDADGAQVEESGKDQWRFVQNNQNTLWTTAGLLDGYGIKTYPSFRNFSGAIFGQVDWKVTNKLTILPGIRLNYDQKEVDFKRETYGGLQTTNAALLALKQSVYSNQSFADNIEKWNLSGQLTAGFRATNQLRFFATYSLGFKPVGLNLGGLPTDKGQVLINLATVKPEEVYHTEFMIKSEPLKNAVLDITIFNTDIYNYQTNVRSTEVGVNRGYLANAEQVRVSGVEVEANYAFPQHLRLNGSLSYTDGRYISFSNAPVPIEETGGNSFKNISGEELPGISKWAFSGGAEVFTKGKVFGQNGEFFVGLDVYARSSFSSSPSFSQYLNISGYALVNGRLGFRTNKGITLFVWSRNLGNVDYFEQLLQATGNVGYYAGVLGDPRTYGVTIRYSFF